MDDEWVPANDVERGMAEAIGAADHRAYFQRLAECPLFLPELRDGGDPAGGQQLVTARLFGQTYLLAFTSLPAMVAATGGVADSYAVTTCAELRERWPSPDWRLAVNPGTPIDAYLAIDTVAAAAEGTIAVPTLTDALRQEATETPEATGPAEQTDADTDAALAAAAAAGDSGRYLTALLDATVLVPTTREVDAARLLEPDFPWRSTGPEEAPAVAVFTSVDALRQACPPSTPHIVVAFAYLAALWPERYALAVNPGGATAVSLPGDQVGLLPLWNGGSGAPAAAPA